MSFCTTVGRAVRAPMCQCCSSLFPGLRLPHGASLWSTDWHTGTVHRSIRRHREDTRHSVSSCAPLWLPISQWAVAPVLRLCLPESSRSSCLRRCPLTWWQVPLFGCLRSAFRQCGPLAGSRSTSAALPSGLCCTSHTSLSVSGLVYGSIS